MSIMEHPHSATGAAADVAGDLKQWLDAFRAEHGRPPRVLHVGNIANNAYNNAKLLREAGLDCDVLCHDYYHIMGCPEWEDADFDGPVGDHFRPQWKDLDLHGYRRPAWFAQGPLWSSLRYLIARREGAPGGRNSSGDACNGPTARGTATPPAGGGMGRPPPSPGCDARRCPPNRSCCPAG